MKRATTFIIVFFITSLTVSLSLAQESAEANFNRYQKTRKTIGPNFQLMTVAGVNGIAYQDNTLTVEGQEQAFSASADVGTSVGLLVDYNTSLYGLALQTGLVFSQYLSTFKLIDADRVVNFQYADSYLILPVILKVYPFSRAGRWTYLKAGFNLGMLLDSRESIRETVFATQQLRQADTNNTDVKKDSDVQVVLGAGMSIPLADNLSLNLEGNFHQGLVDTRLANNSQTDAPEFKTQGYSALFGLSFQL